jgi:hypothetical protein
MEVEWSATRSGRFTPEKNPDTQGIRNWVNRQSPHGRPGQKQISCPYRHWNLGPSIPWPSCYTGYAIPFHLGRLRGGWKIMKRTLKVEYEHVDWIHLTQDRTQWQDLQNTETTGGFFGFHKRRVITLLSA